MLCGRCERAWTSKIWVWVDESEWEWVVPSGVEKGVEANSFSIHSLNIIFYSSAIGGHYSYKLIRTSLFLISVSFTSICKVWQCKYKGQTLKDWLHFFTAFKDTVKPLYWTRSVWELDPDDPDNNGYRNEDLIVWMRSAAFPTFRKLYRKIDHSQEGFINGLPAVCINFRFWSVNHNDV